MHALASLLLNKIKRKVVSMFFMQRQVLNLHINMGLLSPVQNTNCTIMMLTIMQPGLFFFLKVTGGEKIPT
jgi:hypothetical protein